MAASTRFSGPRRVARPGERRGCPAGRGLRARALAVLAALGTLAGAPLRAEGPGATDIRIHEIHYHPPGPGDGDEFLELRNTGPHWVDLSGWRLEGGVRFEVPSGTELAPGAFLVLARSPGELAPRVGDAGDAEVLGGLDGRLSDAGELLLLRTATGRVVVRVRYRDGTGFDGGLWPAAADGGGASLELVDPHGEPSAAWSWAASRVPSGTPGAPNSAAGPGRAERARGPGPDPGAEERPAVNEVRAEGDERFVEIARGAMSTRELTRGALRILGEDEDGLPRRDDVPLADAATRGHRLVIEGERFTGAPFAWEAVLLLDARGERLDTLRIPGRAGERSVGRIPDGTGPPRVLSSASPGRRNAAPDPPPVAISEILYHDRDGSDGEFVELHHTGRTTLDLGGWRLDDAIRFTFPEGTRLEPGAHLAVAREPGSVAPHLGAGERGRILGPWKGRLSNRGERIVLEDARGNPVDEVIYEDRGRWPRDADGRGFSVELVHPDLDNRAGAAWTLGPQGGSPARPNVRARESPAPVVSRVTHAPAVPAPGERVEVRCEIVSGRRVSEVLLAVEVLREDGERSRPAVERMRRRVGRETRGHRGEGGLWTAVVRAPRRPVVLGYRIHVRDRRGRAVQAPPSDAGDRDPPGQERFPLPVEPPADGEPGLPRYRVVLSPADAAALADEGRRSERWFPCSFIPELRPGEARRGGRVFHGARVRFRGSDARREPEGRMSYRLALAPGDRWGRRDSLILNASEPHRQKAGGDLLRLAGLPAPRVRCVRLLLGEVDDRRYLDVEPVDNPLLADAFGDDEGLLFRGYRGNPVAADFRWHGRDADAYRRAYRQENHGSREDISDLLELIETLDTPVDDGWLERVREVVDVDEWATYFAANNLIGNDEGGLSQAHPDDYYLYHRPSDGRWVLIPWDHDTTFDEVRMPLFRPSLPVVRRFLRHPGVAPIYRLRTQELLDGPLGRGAFAARMRRLEGVFRDESLDGLRRFVRRRHVVLREELPRFPHAELDDGEGTPPAFGSRVHVPPDLAPVPLAGWAAAVPVHSVRVDGRRAAWDPVAARWTAEVPAATEPRSAWLELRGPSGGVVARRSLRLEPVRERRAVPSVLPGETVWEEREAGVVRVLAGDVEVPPGARLVVRPGVEVVALPGARLLCRGTLRVEADRVRPATFRPAGWERAWRGIVLRGGGEHRLAGARFEGGAPGEDDGSPGGREAFLRAEDARVTLEDVLFRGIRGTALAASGGELTVRGATVADGRHGLRLRGVRAELEGLRLVRLAGDGLRIEEPRGTATVTDLTVRDAQGAAFVLRGGEAGLAGGALSRAATGIVLEKGARLHARGTVLASLGAGLSVRETGRRRAAGRARLEDAVLGPCREVLLGPAERVRLDGCRIDPTVRWPAGLDPSEARRERVSFRAPGRGDFREAGPGRAEPRSAGKAARGASRGEEDASGT